MTDSPRVCADEYSLVDALKILDTCEELVLDCEGQNLGEQGGSLSIITLRPLISNAPTFLIDVTSLDTEALRPIFGILESVNIKKVMFDGRTDFSALYHGHQVELQNVLDPQLADLKSRRLRGEGEDEQLARLYGYLNPREVQGQRASYIKVHKLGGLEQCVREHGISSVTGAKSNLFVDHEQWMKRPLPDNYVRYAALDTSLIHLLYDKLRTEGFLSASLADESMRYVQMWKVHQPQGKDPAVRHGLLPLGILDYSPHHKTYQCSRCQRLLPSDSFSSTGLRLAWKRQCWVCRAIAVRDSLRENWDRGDEPEYESDDDCHEFVSDLEDYLEDYGYDADD